MIAHSVHEVVVTVKVKVDGKKLRTRKLKGHICDLPTAAAVLRGVGEVVDGAVAEVRAKVGL